MGLRDRLAEQMRAAMNAAQDAAVAFDRAGGLNGIADRVAEQLRAQEQRLLEAERAMSPDHVRQVRVWYARLGLAPGASADEVRKAFRGLMRQYHPDRFVGSAESEQIATRLSQELTVAYEGLLAHLGER